MNQEQWVLEFFDPEKKKWGTFLLDSLEYEHCFRKMRERIAFEERVKNQLARYFNWRMRELTTNEVIPGELIE